MNKKPMVVYRAKVPSSTPKLKAVIYANLKDTTKIIVLFTIFFMIVNRMFG